MILSIIGTIRGFWNLLPYCVKAGFFRFDHLLSKVGRSVHRATVK